MIDYPLEPFRHIVTEMLPITKKMERVSALETAHYNPFEIPSDRVTIDLLTDSGTGAITREQQACSMRGDESYACSPSWLRLKKSILHFTGLSIYDAEIIPVHQGRGAENVLADIYLDNGAVVLSNTLFDTTRANFGKAGATCIDLPAGPPSPWSATITPRFRGNIDIHALKHALIKHGGRVKLVVLVLTNNSGGGQPVSLQNIEAASDLARTANVPLLIDACRIAENAYFIQRDELPGSSIPQIIRMSLAQADLAFMSLKKDGLAHMGGFILLNRRRVSDSTIRATGSRAILQEGFKTYGGMSGKDMEIAAQGLREVVNPIYLRHRIGQVERLHAKLKTIGFPVVEPVGGHGVFIDAAALLPHIPPAQFPGHALATAFYREGGIRGVEIGSLMFEKAARHEYVRLAIPRLTYTQSHLDYVAVVAERIFAKRQKLRGFKIVEGAENPARHFSCKLKPV